jgi:transposase
MDISEVNSAFARLLKVAFPWQITKVEIQHNTMVSDVYIDYGYGSKFPCPECGKECPVHDGSYQRWRYLDLFDYRCYLNIKIPRTRCKEHKIKVVSSVPWGRLGTHYCYALEAKIMRLSLEMSMSAISQEIGEPDSNLWRVFRYHIGMAVQGINMESVKRISVDETANKRGHDYVTIFTDLDSAEVLLVVEGRKKETFEQLYGTLFDKGGHPGNIELFSMDMSKSYKSGRASYFAHSKEVFDRFHIKKGLNQAVDKVRKKEVVENESLKKTKYIWLKNEKNLTDKEKSQLNNFLIESTTDTANAYQLKGGFDHLWNVQAKAVEPLLNEWINLASSVQLKPINTFINTIKNNYNGVVNSMITGITNAVAEGINSIIQMAKSRARGFRNIENFKAMIYFLGNDFKFNFHCL